MGNVMIDYLIMHKASTFSYCDIFLPATDISHPTQRVNGATLRYHTNESNMYGIHQSVLVPPPAGCIHDSHF